MKIPPYIKKEDIQKTVQIANKIRNQEGISSYLFFKRLAIVAMYGELIILKISYHHFLQCVEKHVEYSFNNSITAFGGFNRITKKDKNNKIITAYLIPKYIIKYGTQADVEKLIYNNIINSIDTSIINKEKLEQILISWKIK